MKIIDKFWLNIAKNLIWEKFPKDGNKWIDGRYYWFRDGKLNIAKNCLLNKKKKEKKKNAIIFKKQKKKVKEITYEELTNKVNHFSIFIRNLEKENNTDFKQVIIHASASEVSAVSMLAFAKLGVHFSVIFEDLPEHAIDERIKLIKPDLIITRDLSKKHFFTKVLKKNKLNNSIIIFSNKIYQTENFKHYNFHKYNIKLSSIKYESYLSNHKLFTLFTSGSTGAPKGIQHSSAPYLVYSKYSSFKKFGMNKKSVVLTASDAGWINGHTYALFSPLSFGATTILVESPFMLLDYLFLEKILKKYKITILYLPVTLLRLLKGIIPPNKFFYTNYLKAIGSMGEPLAKNVADWFSHLCFQKKKSVVNTYFQTETGGIISAPNYNQIGEKTYGSVGTTLNKFIKFSRKKTKKMELEITTPWPGCMIDVINGPAYWKKYWNKKKFKLFDYGSFNKKNLIVHGRSDDVINIRGHRLGSGEIEAKILELKDIIEACAVSTEDLVEGAAMTIFVSTNLPKKKFYLLESNIKLKIFNSFGSYAIPKNVYLVRELPKTRSGKILRRVLRKICMDKKTKDFGDLSTIINNNSIKNIKKAI